MEYVQEFVTREKVFSTRVFLDKGKDSGEKPHLLITTEWKTDTEVIKSTAYTEELEEHVIAHRVAAERFSYRTNTRAENMLEKLGFKKDI
jgi:hypothetical protein